MNSLNPLSADQLPPKSEKSSPFYAAVPYKSHPTDVLAKRFELWRQVIKSLINYLRSISIANNQYSMINNNIVDTISFPFFTNLSKTNKKQQPLSKANEVFHEIFEPKPTDQTKQSFFAPFGEGSIQDLQILLKKYHLNLSQHQYKVCFELQKNLIPRLEELQKDLLFKIKEIKNLTNDFKNTLDNEIAITGQMITDYTSAVKSLQNGVETDESKKDPFLIRLKLELQLKQQLNQENYLEEAFMNLQITGLELEKIIFKEIQDALNVYSELISQEIFVLYNSLINELHEGVISKKNYFEWDQFIERDNGKHLMKFKHDDELPTPRKISQIYYPFNKSVISKTIKSGYLLKKSKFLKNYSKSFFILTLNYLHEFKSENLMENLIPLNSIKLNDCILTESNEIKFQLHVKSTVNSMKNHNYVFKKSNEMTDLDFKKWIVDLKNLTSFNSFNERYIYYERKLVNSGSRSGSTSNTPVMEIGNPMDSYDLNKKLQNLQINIQNQSNPSSDPYPTMSTPLKSKPISQPQSNIKYERSPTTTPPPSNAPGISLRVPSDSTKFPSSSSSASDSNQLKPKLNLNLDNIPQFNVQGPTPIHQKPANDSLLKDNYHEDQQAPHPVTNTTIITANNESNPQLHSILNNPLNHSNVDGNQQHDSNFQFVRPSFERSQTPAMGAEIERATTPMIGEMNSPIEKSHIDLNQPLYNSDDQVQNDESLEKLMQAMKNS